MLKAILQIRKTNSRLYSFTRPTRTIVKTYMRPLDNPMFQTSIETAREFKKFQPIHIQQKLISKMRSKL